MRTLNVVIAAIAITATLLLGTPAHAQPAVGTYLLPDSLTPAIPGSNLLKEGGFSSLFYVGHNEFWTITDRGPNVTSGSFLVLPVPNFQPTIYKIRLNMDGTLNVIGSLPLMRPDGTPVTGLPEPAPYNTGEVAADTNLTPLGTDDFGFDTEGILRAPDGTFWFCEEYAPGIAHVAADGRVIDRVRPQPAGGLPDILKKRVVNRGFEGIAMTPNGKIYGMVQSGLANGFANTATANTNAGNNTEMMRLVEYDPATGNTRMFAYLMDAGYPASGGGNARRRDIKIGDMAAVNNDELIVTEHVTRGTSNVKKIYKISLSGATPITAESFTVGATTKSLEELSRTEITTVAGITPLPKTLVIDLNAPGAGNTPWPVELDKPEGLAIVSPTRIAICNDNDFAVDVDSLGHIIVNGKPTKTVVYDLATPLNFQQPSQVTLDPVGNAPVCPGNSVTFTAAAIGAPAPTVQWQVSTDAGAHYTNVAGATSDALTIAPATLAMNGNLYRAVYTNANGTGTSAAARLSVVDSLAPVPSVAVLPTVTGVCSATVATAPTAVDNCAGTITGTTADPLSYTAQGTYTIHWRFDDHNGNVATQTQTVIVRDTVRPTITVTVSPTSLSPANGRLYTITATVTANDNCSGVSYVLTSITSSDADRHHNGHGDHDDHCNAPQDIQNAAYGTPDRTFDLRADRDDDETRTYTITYTATDAAGNTATATATVTVPGPHDNGHGHDDDNHGNDCNGNNGHDNDDHGRRKLVIAGSQESLGGAGFASTVAPTPFSAGTTLGFTLAQDAVVRLRIFDVRGTLVATLADGTMNAGVHGLQWNGSASNGTAVAAGTYFYTIEANGVTETGSMVVVR
ncbi:MAG: esterase-like activity of phytase family protein [Bacteroidetes bacterium]|nr:esterase-like activity of phytase family protein [Bacteroidota bacterium]